MVAIPRTTLLFSIAALAHTSAFGASSNTSFYQHSQRQPSEPLLAQMSYEGYLTCQNSRGSCEVELNNKKSEIKQLCYQIWTGNWPESREYSPETIRMYISWCDKAKDDIQFAEREFPALAEFISRYKSFNPSTESSDSTQVALKNSEVFLGRCTAGAALRASNAMELWGTRKYGDWTIPSLERLVPSRYSSVISACGKKSWVRDFVAAASPALAVDWKAQQVSLSSSNCLQPANANSWTRAKLEDDKQVLSRLSSFVSSGQFLQSLNLPPSVIDSQYLSEGIQQGLSRLKSCRNIVQTGETAVSELEARQAAERQRVEALALEMKRKAEEAKAAADRRATLLRQQAAQAAAAAKASADRRAAAERAASEAKKRQQKERATLTDSVF